MTPSATNLVMGSLLWVLVIHFSLSRLHHPVFRMMLVLSLGAFFWWLDQNRPPEVSHNVMWIAPTIGLIINLWGIMMIRLDKRVIISLLIGGLIIGLVAWAVVPAGATDNLTNEIHQLPPKEQLMENSGLTGAPPISAEFLRKINDGR